MLLVLAIAGCPPKPPPIPPPAPGVATCVDVCGHYAELGCDAAKPTAEGTSCGATCTNVQTSGVIAFNLDCRVRAKSCAEAERCERK